MKYLLLFLIVGVVAMAGAKTSPIVLGLRCEYKVNPLGIDILQPRLSWIIQSADRGEVQTAYQIRVATEAASLQKNQNLVWDSGQVASAASIHVAYAGPALQSGTRYYWQVRIWDGEKKASSWSEAAWWEMGLLQSSDWKASWIEPGLEEDEKKSCPSPMLRRDFNVAGKVASARLYVTSKGLYEIELNGTKVGDQVLTPGWTAYDSRIQYQTYDVAGLLKPGANAIGAMLGDGWYRGFLAFQGQRNSYGKKLALCAQLRITYADGKEELVTTDAGWKAATGALLVSDIYNGETYDSRLEKKGWSQAGYAATDWKPVTVIATPRQALIAPEGPAVRKIKELKPVKIFKTPKGEQVVDMGQNMVGWIRLKANGPAGTRVSLVHFEVLDKDGNVYLANLRAAKQTDEFTLNGSGEQVYEPRFTFHGFRYVQVKEYPGELTTDGLTGVVVCSDYPESGSFECSNPMINQLQHNIQWGQRGNFVDVPTDCPQRDERLGWTGDAQVFSRTACFNGDVAGFYTKWLKDLALDQKESGAVPHVIPNVLKKEDPTANVASAGWADAAVIVPWTVYLCYGDVRVLQQQYPSMKAWVDYMAKKAGSSYLWNTDFTFGDWLAYATNNSDYPGATTDKDLVCQAYFARSTEVVLKTAELLGKKEDAAKYTELLRNIKKAFNDEFVTKTGRLASNTQTAYGMALGFNLLPEDLRAGAAKRLAADVRKFKHITTGFLGAPLMCQVLSDWGYWDEAFMLLNRKEYPSWLYPITRGATTIWERWDGIRKNGSFQDEGMNSFNHYAYGAIGEWLYREVAGIEIDDNQPGYRHIIFQPHPGGELNSVKAEVNSMYGPVASSWNIQNKTMTCVLTVPANTTAKAILPRATLAQVLESGKPLAKAKGVADVQQQGDTVTMNLGSGQYTFSYPYSE